MDLCPGCDRPENDHDPRCLMLNFKPANRPSPSVDCYATLHDKFTRYFCKETNCSDSNDEQYPDCQIAPCQYRDWMVNDLIEIIKNVA
jgi:hypothetical protein